MAVPKRKTSKARRDKRRSSVWKISAPDLQKCSQCGEMKLNHRICEACGYYKGEEILRDGKVVTAQMKADQAEKDAKAKKPKTPKADTKSITEAPKKRAIKKTVSVNAKDKPAAPKKRAAKKAEVTPVEGSAE